MSPKRALILALIVLVVLVGGYIYVFQIAQLHISAEQKAFNAQLGELWIVYECKRDSNFTAQTYDLCAINADGSDKRDLATGAGETTTYTTATFNNSGQLIYHCDYFEVGVGGVQHGICVRENESAEEQRLDFPRDELRSDLIGFNDSGEIVTSCDGRLCYGRMGVEGYAEIPGSDFNGQAIGPQINSRGDIAFTCWLLGNVRSREICAIQPDGSDARVLSQSGEGRSFNPRFIDDDRLIYNCGDRLDQFNVCMINYDGSEQVLLTNATGREDALNPVVAISNSQELVIYECWSDVQHARLCMMNLDGSDVHQLTPDVDHEGPYQYINPSVSAEGVVVFGCDGQVCRINLDGTGFAKLTGDDTGDYDARRPVIFSRSSQ